MVVKSTPGHTPGHQVLFVKLPKTGPVVLAGDLYHYPEESTTGRIPTFEFNAAQSKASRAKVEAFVKQAGAQLWIEHDMATHAKLPKARRSSSSARLRRPCALSSPRRLRRRVGGPPARPLAPDARAARWARKYRTWNCYTFALCSFSVVANTCEPSLRLTK